MWHFLLSVGIELALSFWVLCKWILLFLGILIATIVLIPFCLLLAGYKVNANSSDVAADAAKIHDITLCRRMINYGIFGPPSGESRSHCVNTYARITHDPSVCELLMPSEYGFSCIGAAENRSSICTVAFERKVEWGSYLDGTRKIVSLEDCIAGRIPAGIGQSCCIISKVVNLRGFDDCSLLSHDQTLHEECLSQLALKTGKSDICDPISGTGSRVACELRAKYKSALKDLPVPLGPENLKQSLPDL